MKPAYDRTLRAAVLCAIASASLTNFVACAKGSGGGGTAAAPTAATSVSDGPGGTGGGNVVLQQSTLAEVEAVVDHEFAELPKSFTGPSVALQPFLRLDYEGTNGNTPEQLTFVQSDFARLTSSSKSMHRLVELVQEITLGATLAPSPKDTRPGGTESFIRVPRVESVLPLIKLDKRRDRPCDDSAKTHHDGSANGLVICVSLNRLTRLPTSALKGEVRALLAHEFMHILGYAEADAQLMQRYLIFESMNGNVQKVAAIVNQFGYEIGYAKMLVERPELVDPEIIMHGYFEWTRDAHLNFHKPMLKLVEGDVKNPWLPRIEQHRDKMQRLAGDLILVAAPGADPENKKPAAFEALKAAWIEAQQLALQIAPVELPAASAIEK